MGLPEPYDAILRVNWKLLATCMVVERLYQSSSDTQKDTVFNVIIPLHTSRTELIMTIIIHTQSNTAFAIMSPHNKTLFTQFRVKEKLWPNSKG